MHRFFYSYYITNNMKYKIYVILLTLFSFVRKTEWWYQNDNSGFNGKISLNFILLYISCIVVYLLYKSRDKNRFLFIIISLMNIIDLLIYLQFYIGSIHVLD